MFRSSRSIEVPLCLLTAGPAPFQYSAADLRPATLQEPMRMETTSASRRAHSAECIPAAVSVICGDETEQLELASHLESRGHPTNVPSTVMRRSGVLRLPWQL